MLECVGAVFKTLAETLLIEQIHETAASSQAGRKSCEPGWTYNQRALPFQCQMQCHCAGTQIRMQQRHTSRNSPLQDLATSAFALHWVLEVASGCRLGVATLATFCLGAPNITQLVLKDCQYPRLIPGVLYIIYIYIHVLWIPHIVGLFQMVIPHSPLQVASCPLRRFFWSQAEAQIDRCRSRAGVCWGHTTVNQRSTGKGGHD